MQASIRLTETRQTTAAGSGGYLGSMNNKEDDADRDY